MLCVGWGIHSSRQRLECGGFSTAFVRTKMYICLVMFRTYESGGKHAALQTLRAGWGIHLSRQRLECGGFSTAFVRTKVINGSSRPARAKVVSPPRTATPVQDARPWFRPLAYPFPATEFLEPP